ncbi:MAG: thioesterase family protein [Paracoccus sp. (in: a-proteobacteria)]|nr:thioesterase family protein [Paracoccus sp. (in: a-proteobacteria)]
MSYRREIRIEFNHCDPAGIVFFPRYYEMANSVIENFFRDAVGYPFERMMAEGAGSPTARIETDFRAPSRLGEMIGWTLRLRRLGGSSATFEMRAEGGGVTRLITTHVLVWLTPAGRPGPWPDTIREKLADMLETT